MGKGEWKTGEKITKYVKTQSLSETQSLIDIMGDMKVPGQTTKGCSQRTLQESNSLNGLHLKN